MIARIESRSLFLPVFLATLVLLAADVHAFSVVVQRTTYIGADYFDVEAIFDDPQSTTWSAYLDVSFPRYVDHIELLSSGDFDNATIYSPGDLIYLSDHVTQIEAAYYLVSAEKHGHSDDKLSVTIRIYPSQTGVLPVYSRGTLTDGSTYEIWPTSSNVTDQQGWPVRANYYSFTMPPSTDVTVESLTINGGSPIVATMSVPVEAVVGETNGVDAGTVYYDILVDDQPFVTNSSTLLDANESHTATFSLSFADPGTHSISVVVDPDNLIEEDSETNNLLRREFEVLGSPELVVAPEVVLDLGGIAADYTTTPEAGFQLTNAGGGSLEWSLEESIPWAEPVASSGTISNETTYVRFLVDTSAMMPGDYDGEVVFRQTGTVEQHRRTLRISVTPYYTWSISPPPGEVQYAGGVSSTSSSVSWDIQVANEFGLPLQGIPIVVRPGWTTPADEPEGFYGDYTIYTDTSGRTAYEGYFASWVGAESGGCTFSDRVDFRIDAVSGPSGYGVDPSTLSGDYVWQGTEYGSQFYLPTVSGNEVMIGDLVEGHVIYGPDAAWEAGCPFGPELYVSHDGGTSWTPIPIQMNWDPMWEYTCNAIFSWEVEGPATEELQFRCDSWTPCGPISNLSPMITVVDSNAPEWPSYADPRYAFRIDTAAPGFECDSYSLVFEGDQWDDEWHYIYSLDRMIVLDSDRLAQFSDDGGLREIKLWNNGLVVAHIACPLPEETQFFDAVIQIHNDESASPMTWQFGHPEDPGEYPDWGYYGETEVPVSVLVPPGGRMDRCNLANEPVFLIHGVNSNIGMWDDLVAMADWGSQGYDLWRFGYPYDQRVVDNADLFQRGITHLLEGQSGNMPDYDAEQVSIVSHSMGGIVTRTMLGRTGTSDQVRKVCMLAPPSHGSYTAWRVTRGLLDPGTALISATQGVDSGAPAYANMIMGSDFIHQNLLSAGLPDLNNDNDISTDYLVVAGYEDRWLGNWYDLLSHWWTPDILGSLAGAVALIEMNLHREIRDQEDVVVSVSSANLLQYGVPLGLVYYHHINIPKAYCTPGIVFCFLEDNYSELQTSVSELHWVDTAEQLETVEVENLALDPGILVIGLRDGRYGGDYYLRTDHAGAGSGNYTCQISRSPLQEYDGVLKDLAGNGNFVFLSHELSLRTSTSFIGQGAGTYHFDLVREEVVDNDSHITGASLETIVLGHIDVPMEFRPTRYNYASFDLDVTESFVLAADNRQILAPVEKSSLVYEFEADASMDTVIFNLSASVLANSHGFALSDPSGNAITPENVSSFSGIGFVDGSDHGFAQFVVTDISPGSWSIQHAEGLAEPIAAAFFNAEIGARVWIDPEDLQEDGDLVVRGEVYGNEGCSAEHIVLEGFMNSASESDLAELGEIEFTESSDSRYIAQFSPQGTGHCVFRMTYSGIDPDGFPIQRIAETSYRLYADDPLGVDEHQDESDPTDGVSTEEIPSTSGILGSWPNPFNPRVHTQFALDRDQYVRVDVYDVTGRRVRTLADRIYRPGIWTVEWNGLDARSQAVSAGVYFVRLETETMIDVEKVILVR